MGYQWTVWTSEPLWLKSPIWEKLALIFKIFFLDVFFRNRTENKLITFFQADDSIILELNDALPTRSFGATTEKCRKKCEELRNTVNFFIVIYLYFCKFYSWNECSASESRWSNDASRKTGKGPRRSRTPVPSRPDSLKLRFVLDSLDIMCFFFI